MIGAALKSKRTTCGGSRSLGRSTSAVWILSRTSWIAWSALRSSSNWMVMRPTLSMLVERRSLMPLTVDTASSSFSTTLLSIVSGSAPG